MKKVVFTKWHPQKFFTMNDSEKSDKGLVTCILGHRDLVQKFRVA